MLAGDFFWYDRRRKCNARRHSICQTAGLPAPPVPRALRINLIISRTLGMPCNNKSKMSIDDARRPASSRRNFSSKCGAESKGNGASARGMATMAKTYNGMRSIHFTRRVRHYETLRCRNQLLGLPSRRSSVHQPSVCTRKIVAQRRVECLSELVHVSFPTRECQLQAMITLTKAHRPLLVTKGSA